MKLLERFKHREYKTESGSRLMDAVRQQFVPAGPEEHVRQDVIRTLTTKYGYPLLSLLSEKVVERGVKKLDRADVLVELPVRKNKARATFKDSIEKPWWSTAPLYSQQYTALAAAFNDTPGLRLIKVPDMMSVMAGGKEIRCQTLGFYFDGYGTSLHLLPEETMAQQLGLPRILSLRVQGYGMNTYEREVAARLGINQCEWSNPGCTEATEQWEQKIGCLMDAVCARSTEAISVDGSLIWGILYSNCTLSVGVLASLDTNAKGLDACVEKMSGDVEALEGEPEDEDDFEDEDQDDVEGEEADYRTFIVVECKAPSVNYTKAVLDQAMRYAKKLTPNFVVLTNGTWTRTYWMSEGKIDEVEDIPSYVEAVSGKYHLTRVSPELPHQALPADADSSTVLLHARGRGCIGADTSEQKWRSLLRLEDCFLSPLPVSGLPLEAPAGLSFQEDWGPHWHEVGNPSGGKWPGQYRTFLIKDKSGKQFMLGLGLISQLKAVKHSSYGNRMSQSVLIGALSFDSHYHPGIQYGICNFMVKNGTSWNLRHDGRATVGKGACSRTQVLDFIRAQAPELVQDESIDLGSFPDTVLRWEDISDFVGRFVAYTWLRHCFKEQIRGSRKVK
jgi:hypothetical protein